MRFWQPLKYLFMPCTLDHFVVAAASLDEGAAWLEEILGVSLSPGGQHVKMGTHNKLVRLGEDVYLEIIATDPTLPAPARPRWFGLDDPSISSTLKLPRLLTWAVRTNDIDGFVARSPFPTGPAQAMSRGALNWLLTIPDDGALTGDGVYPFAIQWSDAQHPTCNLPDRGLSIQRFEIHVPDASKFEGALGAVGFEKGGLAMQIMEAPSPSLTLHLTTPRGVITLSGEMSSSENASLHGETRGSKTGEL